MIRKDHFSQFFSTYHVVRTGNILFTAPMIYRDRTYLITNMIFVEHIILFSICCTPQHDEVTISGLRTADIPKNN